MLTPTQLKSLCIKYNLHPSKSFGQNYLISDAPITAMLDAGEVGNEDTIIEIGPGFGILTLALAAKAKKIISFEIEKKLAPYWEEKIQEQKNIEIMWGDVLQEIGKIKLPKKYKVIANVPYQITSWILRTFLELPNPPTCMVVMVQKEVADRICAKAGDMSLLAVSVQYYGQPKIIKKVPKGNFWPSPKVDSAVVAIKNIEKKKNAEQFFRIVKAAFAQKRKQAWKNISTELGIDGALIKKVLAHIAGNEKARAEELGVEEWEEVVENIT